MIAIEKIEKNFVLQNEITLQTSIIKVKVDMDDKMVNILPVIKLIQNFPQLQFKLYDFEINRHVLIDDIRINDGKTKGIFGIPIRYLNSQVVLMKYSVCNTKEQTLSLHRSEESSTKKQRSKQRTIAQVIDIVKQWRQLHLNPNNKKRLNLQQAAQVIGISKKSLDDYYYQLRLGQKFQFDFRGHLLDRIGVLRTFIKQKKVQFKDTGKKEKIGKNPKQLRIIQQLSDIDLMPFRKSTSSRMSSHVSQQSGMDIQQSNRCLQDMNQVLLQQDNKSVKSIEDQFYNDFQFLLQDPQDPFLNLGGDFKKKESEQINQNYFF